MGEDHTYRYVNASNVAGKCDLLWTNPSLTSQFAAQTLSIDLTNYDGVAILMIGNRYHYSQGTLFPDLLGRSIVLAKKGLSNTRVLSGAFRGDYSEVVGSWRIISVSNSGVTFDAGHYWGYPEDRNNSDCAIPQKIWGIKIPNFPTP